MHNETIRSAAIIEAQETAAFLIDYALTDDASEVLSIHDKRAYHSLCERLNFAQRFDALAAAIMHNDYLRVFTIYDELDNDDALKYLTSEYVHDFATLVDEYMNAQDEVQQCFKRLHNEKADSNYIVRASLITLE